MTSLYKGGVLELLKTTNKKNQLTLVSVYYGRGPRYRSNTVKGKIRNKFKLNQK